MKEQPDYLGKDCGLTNRERIVSIIKNGGETRADELAAILGVTPMAARQHLYKLESDGIVCCQSRASGRGRPSKYWSLTEKSDVYFPDAHRDLTLDMIQSVGAVFGDSGMDKLLEHRAAKQQADYQSAIQDTHSIEDRLQRLALVRTKEGYMADAEQAKDEDTTWFLNENHCPVCAAATACKGLCASELAIFKNLFRDIATVERDEYILAGARRCRYRIYQTADMGKSIKPQSK